MGTNTARVNALRTYGPLAHGAWFRNAETEVRCLVDEGRREKRGPVLLLGMPTAAALFKEGPLSLKRLGPPSHLLLLKQSSKLF
jgi:hypothetical protein